MSRKRCTRKPVAVRPPPGLRPGLRRDQLRDLGLAHLVSLDAISAGQAEAAMLWDYTGAVLTWWRVASLLGVGQPEMAELLGVATRLCERWQQHGVVRFTGPDLALARAGVMVMDMLAEQVDLHTAIEAAAWSEFEIGEIEREAGRLRAGGVAA